MELVDAFLRVGDTREFRASAAGVCLDCRVVSSLARYRGPIAVIITSLALADGVLHLSLDFVIFRGNLFGRLGPPPGAPAPPPGGGGPPQFLLPLNQMFVLNLVGYIVLVLLFWFVAPRLGNFAWIVHVLFILYVLTVFIAWLNFGRPNPQGLGYLSKAIEVLLLIMLLVQLWMDIRVSPSLAASRSPRTVS